MCYDNRPFPSELPHVDGPHALRGLRTDTQQAYGPTPSSRDAGAGRPSPSAVWQPVYSYCAAAFSYTPAPAAARHKQVLLAVSRPAHNHRPSPCSQCAMDVGGGQPGEDTVRRARGHRGCRPRPARRVSHYGSLLHIPFGRVATTAAVASCAHTLALGRRCGGAALCTVGAGLA